jgi:hypothetical protein
MKAILLALLLGGCVTADRQLYTRAEIIAPAGYTRAEVDAINAELACKALARSLLQVARCEVRR